MRGRPATWGGRRGDGKDGNKEPDGDRNTEKAGDGHLFFCHKVVTNWGIDIRTDLCYAITVIDQLVVVVGSAQTELIAMTEAAVVLWEVTPQDKTHPPPRGGGFFVCAGQIALAVT